MKVCIIGAGPAGSFSAYLLAKHFDVEVFENHPEVGKPVQCSGLVTQTIKKVDNIFREEEFENLITTRIKHVRLFSENAEQELKLKEPDIVLDRERFDKWLSLEAQNARAKLHLNSRFLKLERENGKIDLHVEQKGKINKIKTDVLIGADGFFSQVSKCLGNKRDFIPCIQANIAYKSDPETMDIFFSSEYKELFAWIVPKNSEIAEIGLGCKDKPAEKFVKFLKDRGIIGKVTGHTGGPISLYSPGFKNSDNNVFLVGEAASFVKASTLGGIIPSLSSAKALARALIDGKNYEKEVAGLKREMKFHYLARRVLDKFTDSDYDEMLRMCNKNVIKIVEEYSRDEASGLKWRLLMAQPLFVKFALKAL